MQTELTYLGQKIETVHHVSKEVSGYGHWKLKAWFTTADGKEHKISHITTDARLIDDWKDAISDDDLEAIEKCKLSALTHIIWYNQ